VIWLPPKIWPSVDFGVQVQRKSPAYRFQSASIVEKLPRGLLDVRHDTGSQYLNLLCSSSHAPLSMLLFHALRSIFFVLCSSFMLLIPRFSIFPPSVPQPLETSTSSLRLMPSQKSLLSFTGRLFPWVGGCERATQQESIGCQSENHRYKLLNKAEQPLRSTSYIHQ
jgi:hypothetical protein